MNLEHARSVADAVLYEGYLLYPYRASSSKNQARWQFGVIGPAGAEEAGLGEACSISMQTLLTGDLNDDASLVLHLRCLQLQRRQLVDQFGAEVPRMELGPVTWMSWDEAVEQEHSVTFSGEQLRAGTTVHVDFPAGEDLEPLVDDADAPAGTVVRTRDTVAALLQVTVEPVGHAHRLDLTVTNRHGEPVATRADAIAHSLIGAHVIIEAHGPQFVSLVDPPDALAAAAADCTQRRCWPVLGGEEGETDLLLGLPIILYDHPEIAEQSPGALFDATEIDEILTLRVMTMTEEEKAEARATDPRAREIIDRCDEMSPEQLQKMHGILRDPGAATAMTTLAAPDWPTITEPRSGSTPTDVRDLAPPTFQTGEEPWWDPEADGAVDPETDAVTIDGVSVAKGSIVRVHPNRRADAHDIFYADQIARVTSVLSDVDGGTHVAVVFVDDPASEMHDWYGRYFYFAPDELEPVLADTSREERHS